MAYFVHCRMIESSIGISCFLMVHPKACLDICFHIQGGIFSLILLLLQRISFLKSGR